MKVYDISMTIDHNMTVYKNKAEKKPKYKVLQDFTNNVAYESSIEMGMHTGTHMDAPLHMIENGGTIDNTPLSSTIGKCIVVDLTDVEDKITREDLIYKNINKDDFILLKTKNSYAEDFDFNFVFLEKGAAEYLKEKKIKGVGTDALGIERSQNDHETHKILLKAGIVILEGLRLKEVEPGEYFIYAAPLKIKGAEAAPTRAILIKE